MILGAWVRSLIRYENAPFAEGGVATDWVVSEDASHRDQEICSSYQFRLCRFSRPENSPSNCSLVA